MAQDFIVRTNPDAVIATHATPAGIMAIYKKKFKPDLLLGAVVTDYTVHKWWLCEGVDVYFAASENLRAQFDGIDAEVYRREYRFGGNFTRHMIVRSCVVNLIGLSRI